MHWMDRGTGIQAVPVTYSPKMFSANQYYQTTGNCNEDAFLIAAACRTALIPLSILEHGAGPCIRLILDKNMNHFGIFQGGLSPSEMSLTEITNMLDRGVYGWVNAFVEGFRPDGFPEILRI